MERFTIGCCRSGRITTSCPDLDGLSTSEEVFDAMAMLSAVAIREYRRNRDSEITNHLWREMRRLERILNDKGQRQQQMNAIGAETSIDLLLHARRLLRPEFRD